MTVQQITLQGTSYPILFGYGALLDYETRFGTDPLEDLRSQKSLARVTVQVAYAGLSNGQFARDKTTPFALSVQEVGNLISEPGKIDEIMTLFSESMPKAEADEEKKPTAAKAGATAQASGSN